MVYIHQENCIKCRKSFMAVNDNYTCSDCLHTEETMKSLELLEKYIIKTDVNNDELWDIYWAIRDESRLKNKSFNSERIK